MAEAKVVQDLAEVCAGGGETYGSWTTAKAVVQRRYLSARAQCTFLGCAEYLTSILHVLRRHLCIELAREFIDDVLFQALEHFARKAAASSSGSAQPGRTGFVAAAAELLQRLFDSLIAATTRTYTLTGPLPLKVGWNTGSDVDGVQEAAAAAASSTAAALPWTEEVVLHFTLRAVAFLDSVLTAEHGAAAPPSLLPTSSSAICIPWAENLYVAYEQLLALRLTHGQPSTPASKNAAAAPAPLAAAKVTAAATPINALVAPLLSLSVISSRSRAAVDDSEALTSDLEPPSHSPCEQVGTAAMLSQADGAPPTPVEAAVYWITHFASRPRAVNQLFAQYIFHDVLWRGVQSNDGAAASSTLTASTVRESAVTLLQRWCPVQQREALAVARAAIAAYRQALPLVLQRETSTRSSAATRTARAAAEEACDSTAYVQHYGWTWFLDSLTLTLAYGGGVAASKTADPDTQQRTRRVQVCAQVLETYAPVVAELPGLQWTALISAYAAS